MTILKSIPLLCLLFFTTKICGQASNKTPQIATLPAGMVKVRINAPSNRVEIFKTKGTRISIETSIRMNAGTLPLLNYLIKSGRYELDVLADAQKNLLTLSPKKDQKVLLVKGSECQEFITYKIHIPESVRHVETLDADQDRFNQ